MTPLFEISTFHEFYNGGCKSIHLVPFSDLWNYEKNNRLLFRNERGKIRVFIEDDLILLSEMENMCFWVLNEDEDFFYYTDLGSPKTFRTSQFIWKPDTTETSGYSPLEKVRIDLNDKTESVLKGQTIPQKSVGCVQIPVVALKKEAFTNFRMYFQSKKTYWNYRIYSTSHVTIAQWKWNLKDVREEWTFKHISEEKNSCVFRSEAPIPFTSKAGQRIVLQWEAVQNTYEKRAFSKKIPFPDYQNQEIIDDIEVTTTYIHI